jgi:hypothetical protein
MQPNLYIGWNIAREKHQDWLRQAAQERLVRTAEATRGSSTKSEQRKRRSLRLWLVRRRAMA